MAKITSLPSPEIIRGFKGLIDFVEWRGIFYVRKWPITPRSSLSAAHFERAALFGEIVKAYSLLAGNVIAYYQNMAQGIPRTARDLHVSAVLGHLHEREEVPVGWILIADVLLAAPAATIDFQNIPQTYKYLVILYSLRSDRPAENIDGLGVRFNNSNVGYDWTTLHRGGAGEAFNDSELEIALLPATTSPAGAFGVGTINIYDYTNPSKMTHLQLLGSGLVRAQVPGQIYTLHAFGSWRTLTPITRITLFPTIAPNLIAASQASLYGVT